MIKPTEIHVACDTNIFRNVMYGNVLWLTDFIAMAKADVVFSFCDHAVAEIISQFEEQQFSNKQYCDAIHACKQFISQRVPFVPGKKQLMGWCASTPDMGELNIIYGEGRGLWCHMKKAKKFEDLTRNLEFTTHGRRQNRLGVIPGSTRNVLQQERDSWISSLEKVRSGWSQLPLKERLIELAKNIEGEVACEPPLMIRLDAALRHEDAVILQRENKGFDPNSENRRNDGIDYNMSYVFMKRILLCTSDQKYLRAIRNGGGYQATWLYNPCELVSAWHAKQLVRPSWPPDA